MNFQNREISIDNFNKLLAHLDENMQVIAQLLYFGSNQTLDEILSLEWKDVNKEECLVRYKLKLVLYPSFVIKSIIDISRFFSLDQIKGKIFLGRQNLPLNPSTVFRNFKEAGIKSGIDNNFTVRKLIINVSYEEICIQKDMLIKENEKLKELNKKLLEKLLGEEVVNLI